MQKFVITGGKRLNGEIELQGCKNSALPIMAAAVLVNGKCILESCPNLTDVYSASRILNSIGCKCSIAGNTAEIDSVSVSGNAISEKLMGEMRSSIMFVGAILGRVGQCTFSIPGGCELGPRPIDMHLAAFAKLGAEISENGGEITVFGKQKKWDLTHLENEFSYLKRFSPVISRPVRLTVNTVSLIFQTLCDTFSSVTVGDETPSPPR